MIFINIIWLCGFVHKYLRLIVDPGCLHYTIGIAWKRTKFLRVLHFQIRSVVFPISSFSYYDSVRLLRVN